MLLSRLHQLYFYALAPFVLALFRKGILAAIIFAASVARYFLYAPDLIASSFPVWLYLFVAGAGRANPVHNLFTTLREQSRRLLARSHAEAGPIVNYVAKLLGETFRI